MTQEREISQFLQRILSDHNIQVDVRALNDMTKKTKLLFEKLKSNKSDKRKKT